MDIRIREYTEADAEEAVRIWNHIVEEGAAFPQLELLTAETGNRFFSEQSFTGIAYDGGGGEIVGLYILHPNNVGRCGHICNASYAVKSQLRGHHIGEALVKHCMEQGKKLGFRILQFNAVVKSNAPALHLYEKLGFTQLGVIPGGFLMKDGSYVGHHSPLSCPVMCSALYSTLLSFLKMFLLFIFNHYMLFSYTGVPINVKELI